MNAPCSGCGKPPHAGGCRIPTTEAPPASAEETQRRIDYLASDEFKRERAGSLAGRNPEADEDVRYDADGDRFVRASLYECEKARADAAEHWRATYYADAVKARGDLAAANARADEAEKDRADAVRTRDDRWERHKKAQEAQFKADDALAAARRSLENVRALAAKARIRKVPLLRSEEVDHLLRFCAEAGVTGSVLRAAAIAALRPPRRSRMAETPREPDRYETATDALERIARAFDANPTAQHSSAAVASILRYLAHEAPAAAPAADYDPIAAPIPAGDMNGPHGPLPHLCGGNNCEECGGPDRDHTDVCSCKDGPSDG